MPVFHQIVIGQKGSCSLGNVLPSMQTCKPETEVNISIVSKRPILSPLVSVSVSIEAFSESRYQSRYRSRGLSIFCKVLAEFLLSKVSVSVSVPVHFYGISISIGLDSGPQKVSVSVSVSIQGHKKYQYQYRLKISGPVCLWSLLLSLLKNVTLHFNDTLKEH